MRSSSSDQLARNAADRPGRGVHAHGGRSSGQAEAVRGRLRGSAGPRRDRLTDMLERYARERPAGRGRRGDRDEAQDLTPLQWRVVRSARSAASAS